MLRWVVESDDVIRAPRIIDEEMKSLSPWTLQTTDIRAHAARLICIYNIR